MFNLKTLSGDLIFFEIFLINYIYRSFLDLFIKIVFPS
jgi:hypothetical protein